MKYYIFLLMFAAILFLKINYDLKKLKSEKEKVVMLQRDNEARNKIISHMAHEIKTPILGINGILEMIKKETYDEEKIKEYVSKMDCSAKYLNSLIEEFLDLTKVQNGKVIIKKNVVNLEKIIDNCFSIISNRFADRKIKYIKEVKIKTSKIVLADELYLSQIFVNILSNAAKFTSDGGIIIFKVEDENSLTESNVINFEFQIIDTGIGMCKDFLNKIWEPFAQDDNVAMSKYKGSGLGMTITKQFVDLMEGSISVDSEIGKGTTFTIRLPLEIAKENNENEKEKVEEVLQNERLKVLLVDDDELNLEVEKYLVEEKNIEVVTACGGEEALKIFSNSGELYFDAILLDINMPIMNGYEVAKEIRKTYHNDAKKIPIIAITADAYGESLNEIKEAGMDTYISKPIDVNRLLKILEHNKK